MTDKKVNSEEGYTTKKRIKAGIKRALKILVVAAPVFINFVPQFPDIPPQVQAYLVTCLMLVMALEKALQAEKI